MKNKAVGKKKLDSGDEEDGFAVAFATLEEDDALSNERCPAASSCRRS